MAPKVLQWTPKERLLDATRTPEFAMQLPLWRALQTLPGVQIEPLRHFRLFRLRSITSFEYNRS
jgi:hypothetical protein